MNHNGVSNEEGVEQTTTEATSVNTSSVETITAETATTLDRAEMVTFSSPSLASLPTVTTSSMSDISVTSADIETYNATIRKYIPRIATSTTTTDDTITSAEMVTFDSTTPMSLPTVTSTYASTGSYNVTSAELATFPSTTLQSLPTAETSIPSAPMATITSQAPASLPTVATSIESAPMATISSHPPSSLPTAQTSMTNAPIKTITSHPPASLPTNPTSILETETAPVTTKMTDPLQSDAFATDGSEDTLALDVYAPPTDPDDTISSVQTMCSFGDADRTLESVQSIACVSGYSVTTSTRSSLASPKTASTSSSQDSVINCSTRRQRAANVLLFMTLHYGDMNFVARLGIDSDPDIRGNLQLFLAGFSGHRCDSAYNAFYQTMGRDVYEMAQREFVFTFETSFYHLLYVVRQLQSTQPIAFVDLASALFELYQLYSHRIRFGHIRMPPNSNPLRSPNNRNRLRSRSSPPTFADEHVSARQFLNQYLQNQQDQAVYRRYEKLTQYSHTV